MHWLFIWRDNEPIKECRCRLHCAKVGVSCARSNACIYLNHTRTHREMRETTWVEQNHIRMKSEDYKPTYETHVLSGFLHGSDTNSYSINVCYIVSTGGCVCVCVQNDSSQWKICYFSRFFFPCYFCCSYCWIRRKLMVLIHWRQRRRRRQRQQQTYFIQHIF